MATQNMNPLERLGTGLQHLFSGIGGLFGTNRSLDPNQSPFSFTPLSPVVTSTPSKPKEIPGKQPPPGNNPHYDKFMPPIPYSASPIPDRGSRNPVRTQDPGNTSGMAQQGMSKDIAPNFSANFANELTASGAITDPNAKVNFGGENLAVSTPLGAFAQGLKTLSAGHDENAFWEALGVTGGQNNWKGFQQLANSFLTEGYNLNSGTSNPWGRAVNYAISKAKSTVESALGSAQDIGAGTGQVDWNNPPEWFTSLLTQMVGGNSTDNTTPQEQPGPVINPQLLTQPYGF